MLQDTLALGFVNKFFYPSIDYSEIAALKIDDVARRLERDLEAKQYAGYSIEEISKMMIAYSEKHQGEPRGEKNTVNLKLICSEPIVFNVDSVVIRVKQSFKEYNSREVVTEQRVTPVGMNLEVSGVTSFQQALQVLAESVVMACEVVVINALEREQKEPKTESKIETKVEPKFKKEPAF